MSSIRNLKIISVILIMISLSMLMMPWIAVTGIPLETKEVAEEIIKYLLEDDEAIFEINQYIITAAGYLKDFALSPSECVALFADMEDNSYTWFMMLYSLVYLLTIAAGIYAVIFAIRRKPLLKGLDGFIFPICMWLLAVMTVVIVIVCNREIDSIEEMISNVAMFYGYDIDLDIGVRFTFWMVLAVITAVPYVLWEEVLVKSGVGQKAVAKMDHASSKIGEMIEKGNEKIQNYSESWDCPNCGAHVSGESMFCPKCGTKKPEKPVKEEKVMRQMESQGKEPNFCPSCGTPIDRGDRFCKSCGFDFEKIMKIAKPAEPEQEAVQELVMTKSEATLGSVKAIDIPGRGMVKVKLPGGLRNGQTVRLKGLLTSAEGEPKRDLIVKIAVQ